MNWEIRIISGKAMKLWLPETCSHHLCQSCSGLGCCSSPNAQKHLTLHILFLPLIWLLGWVPQASTALDFRMSPKHSCGKITVGTDSYCGLCCAKMKTQPAATHVCRVLGDTDLSHKHILYLIFGIFNRFACTFGIFNLFACTFILIMQHPCVWVRLRSQWWHCWSATAPIITADMIHLALPNPKDKWELLMP